MDEENNPQFNSTFKQATSKLTNKEKLTFFGFVFLAVLVVYLGFQQMSNNLKTPFALFALKHSGEKGTLQKTESQLMEELKNKDTDKDGLSDYDELFIYNTSPYLPDSDSDGIGDKEEIEAGTDPNCPQGQNCYFNEIANPTAGGNKATVLESPSSVPLSLEEILLQSIVTGSPDPKIIRQFLVQNGADPEALNQVSDQDLLEMFQELLESPDLSFDNTILGQTSGLENLLNNPEEWKNIQFDSSDLNLIRQKLRDNGVPEETLRQLDDATLLDLIKQIQYE